MNPTAAIFATLFKAIVVNNFMTVHSPSANCETDDSEGGLDDLRRFLSSRTEEPQITEPAVANIDMHEVGNGQRILL